MFGCKNDYKADFYFVYMENKMSLKYRVFGIPANVDEVVARAQETGEVSEVYTRRQNMGCLVSGCQMFKYEIGVKLRKMRVTAYEWEKSFENFVEGIDDDRFDFVTTNRASHERARELAKDLARKGIPVLYAGETYSSFEKLN